MNTNTNKPSRGARVSQKFKELLDLVYEMELKPEQNEEATTLILEWNKKLREVVKSR